MNNEKYYNYYVETLTNTLTDAIMRNVSLQASVRVSEESIKEYERTIELLDAEIGNIKNQQEEERKNRQISDNTVITDLRNQLSVMNNELNDLKSSKVDYDNSKHQLQHLDTFRNELVKSRKENEELKKQYESTIEELNKKIDYLQLSPAKRKKLEEQNNTTEINNKELIKDGGTF